MTEKTYNGWTNYETWAVKLWIDNDEGPQNYWQEQAEEAFDRAEPERFFTKSERALLDLADALKELHEEALPELTGFAADLLNAAMSEVNWREIAENLLQIHCEDYAKDVQPEPVTT